MVWIKNKTKLQEAQKNRKKMKNFAYTPNQKSITVSYANFLKMIRLILNTQQVFKIEKKIWWLLTELQFRRSRFIQINRFCICISDIIYPWCIRLIDIKIPICDNVNVLIHCAINHEIISYSEKGILEKTLFKPSTTKMTDFKAIQAWLPSFLLKILKIINFYYDFIDI